MGGISSLNKQNKISYLSIAPIFQDLCESDYTIKNMTVTCLTVLS